MAAFTTEENFLAHAQVGDTLRIENSKRKIISDNILTSIEQCEDGKRGLHIAETSTRAQNGQVITFLTNLVMTVKGTRTFNTDIAEWPKEFHTSQGNAWEQVVAQQNRIVTA